jgi:hypothetical protein
MDSERSLKDTIMRATFALAAAVVTLVVAIARPAPAQSLGDVARRADEQRKTTTTPSIRIEMDDSPLRALQPILLDRPAVQQYVDARMAMAKMWHRDASLFERMRGGISTARTLSEVLAVFDRETPIKELFALYQYTSERFLSMAASIEQASRLTQGGFDLNSLSTVERQNYDFAARNLSWLSIMRGRIHKADAGLALW